MAAGLGTVAAAGAAPGTADRAPAGSRSSGGELEWARDALARNGSLDVVSSDVATGVITVRVKSTGELRRVRADDVIAALPPAIGSSASARTPAAPAGEHVIASGPGYSIAASGPGSSASAQQGAGERSEGGGPASSLPVEHRHDPIICQGARLLHIDSRNLVFDGNAVTAEQGCELHITNSSIVARGTGIAARAASVHIDNSFVEGSGSAVDESDGAQVYARGSTFEGLIRRNDTATFHDLGGNVGH